MEAKLRPINNVCKHLSTRLVCSIAENIGYYFSSGMNRILREPRRKLYWETNIFLLKGVYYITKIFQLNDLGR